jgi:TRAP-type mannitol/chloroaromatic compound transport system substrate-binding protein
MLDEFTARNNESLTTLLEEHSTKLRPLPDDVINVLHSNAVVTLEKLKKDDPMAQKISASYEAFLDGVRTYHEISERAYLNARDRVLAPITFTDQ